MLLEKYKMHRTNYGMILKIKIRAENNSIKNLEMPFY
jgi:hypothetical protein